MEITGRCAICGMPCIKCITCKLCGIIVCEQHQQAGVCFNCTKGRVMGHKNSKK